MAAVLTAAGFGWAALLPAAEVHQPPVPVLDTDGRPSGLAEEAVPLSGLGFVTVLVVGMDSARHVDLEPAQSARFAAIPLDKVRGRADTVMVLGLDRRSHTVRILHIPRDSIVTLGSAGEDKITHYMAFFSFFELKKAVENLLQIPVHRYVVFDFEGFKGLVDAIGGVTVTVDHDLMAPEGTWLSRGTHRLNGAQALRLVRHRYGEYRGTLARMDIQRAFLVGLAGEIRTGGALRALAAYRLSPEVVKTNLSLLTLIRLLQEWRDIDPENIVQLSLPGVPESHRWRLDPAGVRRTVEQFWPVEAAPAPARIPGLIPPPVENAPESGTGRRRPAAVNRPATVHAVHPPAPTTASAMGPGPFISRSVAILAGLEGETAWPLAYYPYLQASAGSRAAPVLVYHTHTTESFMPEIYPEPEARAGHDPNEDAFTENLTRSVARVGEEVTVRLREVGVDVWHLTQVHDPGGQRGRTGAYGRSRATALAARGRLGDPVIILDVHRDATTLTATVAGTKAASILLVVARQNRWWQWNYAFARNLELGLAAAAPGLSRGIRILDGRYNQDLSPMALIVEIGGADSTMDECLASARIFAAVLADYLGGP